MNIFDREELSDEMENKTILHCRNSSNRKIIERDKIHKSNIYIYIFVYIFPLTFCSWYRHFYENWYKLDSFMGQTPSW